jgi:hypothetical protein
LNCPLKLLHLLLLQHLQLLLLPPEGWHAAHTKPHSWPGGASGALLLLLLLLLLLTGCLLVLLCHAAQL